MTDLRDARDRWSAANETDRSLLVEASAGTGKTKTLVDRIANLVLADPEEGGISLSEIAALTFTEKAAGEMKERLRGCLEDEMKGARRARAKSALESLDLAEIATIHAFCARLLRERPVEAGVDPDFTTPEPAVIRELFDEVFPGWLDAEARVPKGVVAGLLARGLHPDELSELAWKIHEGRALLQDCTVPVDALSEAREALDELARGFRKLIAQAPGWKGAGEMTALARQLEWLAGLDITGLSQSAVEETFALRNAPKDEEWRERATTLRDRWKKLREALPALPDRVLLAKLVPRVKETLFPLVTAAKRERRLLDFDDLLLTARDLLRHSAPARAHFADRFRALLVDEFQDTDPVQAEIVLRLSAPDGGAAWGDLEIAGGELFVVGDPKQSIYRFRRADVETYDDVSGRFDVDSRLRLATSFRSHPRLVGWINAVFEQVLVAHRGKPWEVEYSPLEPGPVEDAPGAPVVYLLPPDEIPEGTRIGELREMEARAIARWLATRAKGRVPWRDVGILVPKNDAIDVMEKALREAGIPSVAEGGKSYSLREETGAVLAALRAVADPGDGIALAAVLRSFLFSASDADLVEAAEKGFRFDVAGEAPEGCAIAPAVALIQRLRAGRHERPTSETLLELLEQRAAFAALEAGGVPNPRQGVANVERLVASARACDASGLSFREAVAALVRTLKVESPEPRAFEENEDAVRLLTLHKSKGLEFPLVVLASLGLEDRTRGGDKATLRCERPGGLAGVKATVGDRGSVATPRWDRVVAADEERLRAEDRRLLDVGATRAKKQLVVSWWVDPRGKDALAKSYLGPMAAARSVTLFPAGDVEEVVSEIEPFTTTAVKSVEEAVDLAREMSVAAERLERARATASRKLRRAGEHAFVPARAEDLPASDRGDEEVSDRALRVGVAVHGAMERLLDPGRAAPPLAAVLDEAAAELPADARAEVKRLVERLLEDPVVARARAAKRRFVEVPLLHREGAGEDAPLVEGKIDLLFEEADGLVVVDWKTDRVDSPAVLAERTALYAPQLASYEEGLKKALGPGARVKECRLVFART